MFGFPISLDCRGGFKRLEVFSAVWCQRASGTCSCTRFQCFIKPLNLQPLGQRLYIGGQYINQGKIKLQSIQVSKLVIPQLFIVCNLGSYTNLTVIQIRLFQSDVTPNFQSDVTPNFQSDVTPNFQSDVMPNFQSDVTPNFQSDVIK